MCALKRLIKVVISAETTQRQAQPSADINSGQQISVFNPWRVPCVMPAGKLQLALSEIQRLDRGSPCDGLQVWIVWDGMAIRIF